MAKVLIIEDDKLIQKACSDKFTKEGFEVILAENGKDGISKARIEQPDFILLDLIMPVMDGTTTLGHLKQLPETKDIPVAILTVVPDGAPQSLHQEDKIIDQAVAFWEKDKNSLDFVVTSVKKILEEKTS